MRITLVGPVYPYRGGIAHHTTQLALGLQAQGHEVRVISFRRQYPGWLYPGKSDRDPSHSAINVPADLILDPLKPWTWYQAARLIANSHPDLTVIQWWTTFWAPAYFILTTLLNKRKARVIYLIHNTYPHETRPWDHTLARLALQGGNAFIIQTARERDRLAALIPKADIRLCLHPTYPRFSEQPIPQAEARKRLSLPEGAPLLLFFGIVRPYKGLRHLLEAVAKVNQDMNQEVFAYIAGEFWEEINIYQKLIAGLKIDNRVFIEDRYIPNEHADLLFSAADALVAPYTAGTQSGVAGLALSYSLPLIVTDPVAQGIDATNAPFFRVVPPGDAQALANAVRELLPELPKIRLQKCNECPALTDWSRMVSAIEELAKSTE
jgi:glycosyltransferase involved in cell wall biosynthesis